jgi:hypothetical protein
MPVPSHKTGQNLDWKGPARAVQGANQQEKEAGFQKKEGPILGQYCIYFVIQVNFVLNLKILKSFRHVRTCLINLRFSN